MKILQNLMISLMLVSTLFLLMDVPQDVEGSLAFRKDVLINLDGGSVDHIKPDIAVHGERVYIVWEDDRNGTSDIYLRASADGGSSFGPEVRVDDTTVNKVPWDDNTAQREPAIAVAPNGTIYVAWEDNREGKYLIFISCSTDNGATFSEDILIDWSFEGIQYDPAIAVSPDGDIYVAWEDSREMQGSFQIYVSHSGDGIYYSSGVRASDVSLDYDCLEPAIGAWDDGMVHVVWEDDRTWDVDIYMATSNDTGVTFAPSVRVNIDPTSSDQSSPDLAVNDNRIMVVWRDQKMSTADIYISGSVDQGRSFGPDSCVHPDSNIGAQIEPRIDMDLFGNMVVTWSNASGGSDIEATAYYANGTREGTYKVNDPIIGTTQDHPSVALSDAGVAHVVWRDNRDGGIKNIYYSKNESFGETGKAPTLTDERVRPEIGVEDDTFKFVVTYTDEEGEAPAPGYPKLHLVFEAYGGQLYDYPGSPFNMSKLMIPPPDMDYRNGESYIKSVMIERDLDLYYYMSAQAVDGNRTIVNTTMHHLPIIDSDPPTFQLVKPEQGVWNAFLFFMCTVDITDEESGVDPWSVAYQLWDPIGGEWSRWWTRGTFEDIGNGTLRFSLSITFKEGKDNLIRFRARDNLGNGDGKGGYALSDGYPIWVDPRGPIISDVRPSTGTVVGSTTVEVEATISDGGSGVEAGSIRVAYSISGLSGFGEWMNLSFLPSSSLMEEEGIYFLKFSVDLAWGDHNYFRIKAYDILGNWVEGAPIHIICKEPVIIDRDYPPGAVESIQPRVTGSVMPHITWTPAVDPDGDRVYYWLHVAEVDGEVLYDRVLVEKTYWDPDQEFSVGMDYLISIVPTANGLNGTTTNATLTVSVDANRPPPMVREIFPKATGDTTPTIWWEPVEDPEGSEVYYFLRMGRWNDHRDVIPWTSVLSATRFQVRSDLQVGVYEVSMMCSDGVDFSPVKTFAMSIGVFNPVLRVQGSTLVIPQGSSASMNLTVVNLGYMPDQITLELSGRATTMGEIEMFLSRDLLELSAGSSTNSTLSVSVATFAQPGIYVLNITVTSADMVSSSTSSISIRVIDPDDRYGEGTPTSTPDAEDDTPKYLLFSLLGVVILLLIAMGFAYYKVDRKMREAEVEIVRQKRETMKPVKEEENLLKGDSGKEKLKGPKKGRKHLPPKKAD